MKRLAAALVAAALYPAAAGAVPITLSVNTTATLRAAVATANADALNAYTISLAPGTYLDPDLHVSRSMTLDAAIDGTVTLLGASALPNQKGLILADGIGTRLTVDGLTFQGAHIAAGLGANGAGIRDQVKGAGSGLTITDSQFLNNQTGILTGGSAGLERITIRNTAFRDNGDASTVAGQIHGLYINDAASVFIDRAVVCGQVGQGHNYKIRSAYTAISNSESYEGIAGGGCTNAGNASRGIDIPNGGILLMSNVDLLQGPGTGNSAMFEFGAEGLKYASNFALLWGVDFVNTRPNGIGIQWYGAANPCSLVDVTFIGLTTQQSPAGCAPYGPIAATATLAALDDATATAVPEPGSLALLVGGLAGLGFFGWRRRRRE